MTNNQVYNSEYYILQHILHKFYSDIQHKKEILSYSIFLMLHYKLLICVNYYSVRIICGSGLCILCK